VLWRLPHHRGVEDRFDSDIARAIVTGVFTITAWLGDISSDVRAIRSLLEEENGEEDEDDGG
jgi:hypothetical protein